MKNVKPETPAEEPAKTPAGKATKPVAPTPVVSPNPGQIFEEPGTPGGDS